MKQPKTIIRLREQERIPTELGQIEINQVFFTLDGTKCVRIDVSNIFVGSSYIYFVYYDKQMSQVRIGYGSDDWKVITETSLPEPLSYDWLTRGSFFLHNDSVCIKTSDRDFLRLSTGYIDRFVVDDVKVIPLSAKHVEIVDVKDKENEQRENQTKEIDNGH